MKLLPYLCALLILAQACSSKIGNSKNDEIDWRQLTSFRIYDYQTFPEGKDIHTFTDDDIRNMTYVEADTKEAKAVLAQSHRLADKLYLWKGHHFALAAFSDGSKRRIKISTYGGFFFDLTGQHYYEFNEKGLKEWDRFLDDQYTRLHH